MGVPFQLLGELLPNFWIFEKKSISFSEKRKKSWNTSTLLVNVVLFADKKYIKMHFVWLVLCCVNIFITAELKSFSGKSNI